jgi:hypothetical protein
MNANISHPSASRLAAEGKDFLGGGFSPWGSSWVVRGWLIGLGLVAAISCGGAGRIIALSGNLAFGDVPVGSTATATFSIKNSGNETLAVSGISYPDGYTGNWASGQIAAGSSQTVTVTFAPTAPKSYSGTVTVTSSATSGTNTIDVSGTGRKSWTMTGLLKDWLITPHDLAISGQEIFVSGNIDSRVAVLNLNGQILRYYTIIKNSEFDNVCVAITSQGQVLAASSRGVWELKPDGTTGKLPSFDIGIDHMTIGPDDSLYVSTRYQGKSKILKIGLNGATSDLVTIDSNRISDFEFDSNGNLFIADAQYGRILKYSQRQDVETFSTGFADPSGGGPFYLAFDRAGRLYTSSVARGLALVSADGTVIPLGLTNISGDLSFQEGMLYTLDIYTSKLFEINIDNTTILSRRILLEGAVPWYIDLQGEIIVGKREDVSGRKFFNYDISNPGRVESNPLLNTLQPSQYTFDDSGNMYLLFGRVLKKLDSTGKEIFSVLLPRNLQWNARLCHNPWDDKIYYFDRDSNSVIRANAQGFELYHRFSSTVSSAYLSVTRDGKVYAGIIVSDGAKLVDISNSPEERVVWRPNTTLGVSMIHIGSDAKGSVYAAIGPSFQYVVCIDPVKGTAVSVFDASPSRYNWGFVDPQGFIVTDSGTVVVSAPGVLLAFVPDF